MPSLKEGCEHVTSGARGEGVIELIWRKLENDLRGLDAHVLRHDVRLSETEGGMR